MTQLTRAGGRKLARISNDPDSSPALVSLAEALLKEAREPDALDWELVAYCETQGLTIQSVKPEVLGCGRCGKLSLYGIQGTVPAHPTTSLRAGLHVRGCPNLGPVPSRPPPSWMTGP
jgi:hypothetical protein